MLRTCNAQYSIGLTCSQLFYNANLFLNNKFEVCILCSYRQVINVSFPFTGQVKRVMASDGPKLKGAIWSICSSQLVWTEKMRIIAAVAVLYWVPLKFRIEHKYSQINFN